MFGWLRQERANPPAAPRQVAERAQCWVWDCNEKPMARMGLEVPGLPQEAEVCRNHDLAIEFNRHDPRIVGRNVAAGARVTGSAEAGWIVGGLFLIRPRIEVPGSSDSPRRDLH